MSQLDLFLQICSHGKNKLPRTAFVEFYNSIIIFIFYLINHFHYNFKNNLKLHHIINTDQGLTRLNLGRVRLMFVQVIGYFEEC